MSDFFISGMETQNGDAVNCSLTQYLGLIQGGVVISLRYVSVPSPDFWVFLVASVAVWPSPGQWDLRIIPLGWGWDCWERLTVPVKPDKWACPCQPLLSSAFGLKCWEDAWVHSSPYVATRQQAKRKSQEPHRDTCPDIVLVGPTPAAASSWLNPVFVRFLRWTWRWAQCWPKQTWGCVLSFVPCAVTAGNAPWHDLFPHETAGKQFLGRTF